MEVIIVFEGQLSIGQYPSINFYDFMNDMLLFATQNMNWFVPLTKFTLEYLIKRPMFVQESLHRSKKKLFLVGLKREGSLILSVPPAFWISLSSSNSYCFIVCTLCFDSFSIFQIVLLRICAIQGFQERFALSMQWFEFRLFILFELLREPSLTHWIYLRA